MKKILLLSEQSPFQEDIILIIGFFYVRSFFFFYDVVADQRERERDSRPLHALPLSWSRRRRRRRRRCFERRSVKFLNLCARLHYFASSSRSQLEQTDSCTDTTGACTISVGVVGVNRSRSFPFRIRYGAVEEVEEEAAMHGACVCVCKCECGSSRKVRQTEEKTFFSSPSRVSDENDEELHSKAKVDQAQGCLQQQQHRQRRHR